MANERVVNSVNNEYGDRCVDVFVRPDGSYGYKQFRRDPEDQGAWFVTDFDPAGVYVNHDAALAAASSAVPWLIDALKRAAPFAP